MNQHKPSIGILAAVILLALAGAATIPTLARSPSTAVREVHIVVRGMAFHADGVVGPNPTLRVKRGERIRIVLRNEDPGIAHDLRIPAWDAATKLLHGKDDQDVLDVRAPETPGEVPYSCTPHGAMMRGTIIVE